MHLKPNIFSTFDPTLKKTPEMGISSYRFLFNGQERDNEVYGEGNSYTAEYWQYDPRLGRRWNVDPVFKIFESPYAAFANNPIWFVDPNGRDTSFANQQLRDNFTSTLQIVKNRASDDSKEIDRLKAKASEKGWSKEKLQKRIEPFQQNQKLLNDFDRILDKNGPMFYYSDNIALLKEGSDGNTTITDQGENGVTKIRIILREVNGANLIHENRHGNQILNKTTGTPNSLDLYDELDAFTYQQIYDAESVARWIRAVAMENIHPNSGMQPENLTLKEAIQKKYTHYKNQTFEDLKW